MTEPLTLASRNAHKHREVSRILAPFGLTVRPLPAAVVLGPEDGDTYEANALGKARVAAAALGVAVIADDSGIEAAALGGAPGVRSARFAGEGAGDEQNLDLLLERAPAGSALAYVCVIAWAEPGGGSECTFEGRCEGALAARPRGHRGFGYDPAFEPAECDDGRTMAELRDDEKDAISHRGRAARAFLAWRRGR